MPRSELPDPELLEKAGNIVRTGWMQYNYWRYIPAEGFQSSGNWCCCATGAIILAEDPERIGEPVPTRWKLTDSMLTAVRYLESRVCSKGSPTLTLWNDHPMRTQDQVVQVFLDAAADVRAALESGDGQEAPGGDDGTARSSGTDADQTGSTDAHGTSGATGTAR